MRHPARFSAGRPLVIVACLALLAACSSSSTSSSSTTAAPTTAPPTTVAPATTTATAKDWASEHGAKVALTIAAANGLASAIAKDDAAAITKSCEALKTNYSVLRKIPDPPGDLGKTFGPWDDALTAIYHAQKSCSGGVITQPNRTKAATEAKTGAKLLNEVLDKAQAG
jgi:hypothetical protein